MAPGRPTGSTCCSTNTNGGVAPLKVRVGEVTPLKARVGEVTPLKARVGEVAPLKTKLGVWGTTPLRSRLAGADVAPLISTAFGGNVILFNICAGIEPASIFGSPPVQ
jgi:hypothetical protein